MDWTLVIDTVDGWFFRAKLTGGRGGHIPFVQAGAETSDTRAEAVKPYLPCRKPACSCGTSGPMIVST